MNKFVRLIWCHDWALNPIQTTLAIVFTHIFVCVQREIILRFLFSLSISSLRLILPSIFTFLFSRKWNFKLNTKVLWLLCKSNIETNCRGLYRCLPIRSCDQGLVLNLYDTWLLSTKPTKKREQNKTTNKFIHTKLLLDKSYNFSSTKHWFTIQFTEIIALNSSVTNWHFIQLVFLLVFAYFILYIFLGFFHHSNFGSENCSNSINEVLWNTKRSRYVYLNGVFGCWAQNKYIYCCLYQHLKNCPAGKNVSKCFWCDLSFLNTPHS